MQFAITKDGMLTRRLFLVGFSRFWAVRFKYTAQVRAFVYIFASKAVSLNWNSFLQGYCIFVLGKEMKIHCRPFKPWNRCFWQVCIGGRGVWEGAVASSRSHRSRRSRRSPRTTVSSCYISTDQSLCLHFCFWKQFLWIKMFLCKVTALLLLKKR